MLLVALLQNNNPLTLPYKEKTQSMELETKSETNNRAQYFFCLPLSLNIHIQTKEAKEI